MICIYHNKDLDGYCSGAIVKKKFPDAKMLGYDYGKEIPWDEIPLNNPVIMVDVSLPMAEMSKLAIHSGHQLTWIDHHISAINDFKKYKDIDLQSVNAVLENGISACEGAWKYLFPNIVMPVAVKLLGEYDTWRQDDKERWDKEVMPFQYGMRAICNSVESFPLEIIGYFKMAIINSVIDKGETILSYQKKQNEYVCRSSFEIEFEGFRAVCINSGGANSQLFESVYDEEKHDLMIPFVFTGKYWKFSLYTTKDIDCSIIAKSRGGGGHKKASGFEMKELPKEFLINLK